MPEQGNNLRVRYPEIAKELDQSDDDQVEKFVSEVVSEHKQIDVLVNSAYGGLIAMTPHFGKPFWERPVSVYDEAFEIMAWITPIVDENRREDPRKMYTVM